MTVLIKYIEATCSYLMSVVGNVSFIDSCLSLLKATYHTQCLHTWVYSMISYIQCIVYCVCMCVAMSICMCLKIAVYCH